MENNLTPDAQQFLNTLDDLLVKGDDTAKQIVGVITALRGPDHKKGWHRDGVKAQTTIPIRRAALPKTFAATKSHDFRNIGMSFALDKDDDGLRVDLRSCRGTGYSTDDHFTQHVANAGQLLGLKVIW